MKCQESSETRFDKVGRLYGPSLTCKRPFKARYAKATPLPVRETVPPVCEIEAGTRNGYPGMFDRAPTVRVPTWLLLPFEVSFV